MSVKQGFRARSIAALLAVGTVTSLLTGCSGRDSAEAERTAAINAAAARAEAAADRAESAAAKLGAGPAPVPVITEDAEDPAPAEDNADQPAPDAG